MVVSNYGQYGSLHYQSTPGSAWRHMFDCDSKNLLLTVLCILVLVFMLVSVRRYALSYCCVIPYKVTLSICCKTAIVLNLFILIYPCFFRSHFLVFIFAVVCCCVLVSCLALVLSAK